MSHPSIAHTHADDVCANCVSCGTSLPLTEPILVKFQRCYYCGQHHPCGSAWKNRTAPVVAAAAIGVIAIWWMHLPS
jgi:hypothetical protein